MLCEGPGEDGGLSGGSADVLCGAAVCAGGGEAAAYEVGDGIEFAVCVVRGG